MTPNYSKSLATVFDFNEISYTLILKWFAIINRTHYDYGSSITLHRRRLRLIRIANLPLVHLSTFACNTRFIVLFT